MRNTRNKPGGKDVRDLAGAQTHLVYVAQGCGAAAGTDVAVSRSPSAHMRTTPRSYNVGLLEPNRGTTGNPNRAAELQMTKLMLKHTWFGWQGAGVLLQGPK